MEAAFGGDLTQPRGSGVDPVRLTLRSTPAFVEPHSWTQAATGVVWLLINSNSIGVRIPRADCRRRRLWKTSMYSKIAFASSTRVFQRRVLSNSTCIRDQNASIIALS